MDPLIAALIGFGAGVAAAVVVPRMYEFWWYRIGPHRLRPISDRLLPYTQVARDQLAALREAENLAAETSAWLAQQDRRDSGGPPAPG